MWTCAKCGRIFRRAKQQHSCKKVALESHFEGKEKAKELFDYLVERVNVKAGKVKVISIPCCVHLFGTYDFLAALPKKDGLEIRFALDRELRTPRLKACVPLSKSAYKNCFEVREKEELDEEFLGWVSESYHMKD